MSKPSVRPPRFAELTHQAPAAPAGTAASEALEAVREGHRIAHAIVARAEAQAQEVLAAAREQGFEAGRRQALEQVGAELRSLAAALATAAEKLQDARRRLEGELSLALPEAAVEIAARILRRELSVRPEALVHLIREAIAAVAPAPRIDIRLHPEDLATLERHRNLLAEVLAGAEVRFEPAPAVGRGGCFVETPSLTLAAGVPQQLERALALLRGDGE